jgi:uncharacterized membrane protein HdeD (DUF308 family)
MTRRPLPGANALLTIGIVLTLFGVVLLLSPVAVGDLVVRLVALVLVVTGLVQLLHSLRSGAVLHKAVSALLGAIVAAVGILVWFNPELGSGFLTALLMIFFLVNGLWKISNAFRFRPAFGWLWLLFSGLLSLLFVYLLWIQWPLSAAWVIGVLVGLDLLLTGVAITVIAIALRKTGSPGYIDTIHL